MQFKVGPFRAGKADLIKLIKRNNNDVSILSYYCASSMFPVAAAIVFCLEEFPEHKEALEKKMEFVKEFYGYEEVIE